jgi:hypothetical protein
MGRGEEKASTFRGLEHARTAEGELARRAGAGVGGRAGRARDERRRGAGGGAEGLAGDGL